MSRLADETFALMWEVACAQAALDKAAERRASRKKFRSTVAEFIRSGYPSRFPYISMLLWQELAETLDDEIAEVSRRPEAYRGQRYNQLLLLAADLQIYGLD